MYGAVNGLDWEMYGMSMVRDVWSVYGPGCMGLAMVVTGRCMVCLWSWVYGAVYGLDWEVLRGASGPGFDVYSCGCYCAVLRE